MITSLKMWGVMHQILNTLTIPKISIYPSISWSQFKRGGKKNLNLIKISQLLEHMKTWWWELSRDFNVKTNKMKMSWMLSKWLQKGKIKNLKTPTTCNSRLHHSMWTRVRACMEDYLNINNIHLLLKTRVSISKLH